MRVLLLPFTHLEDWSLSILVDGNNDFAVLHASQVLDCPGDADSDVKVRSHNLASLANLQMYGFRKIVLAKV